MANTKVLIKRSNSTSAPASLSAGELAYSYASNTLFIGTSDGTAALSIGGKSLEVFAQNAFNQANTATNNAASVSQYANTGINNAASASLYANNAINDAASASAYANTGINNAASASQYANTGITIAGAAFNKANDANSLAQAAFDVANNAASGSTDQYARDTANSAGIYANTGINNAASASAYANAGINLAQAAFNQGNSTATVANTAVNDAGSASAYANTAINNAASASQYANTAINNAASASAYANTGINNAASASAYANAGITLAQAAYDTANGVQFTLTGDSGTATVANGETLTVTGGDGITTTVGASPDQLTIAVDDTVIRANGSNIGTQVINTNLLIAQNRDLSITGNLYVTGNVVSQNVQQLSVTDPLIVLGVGNYSTDSLDIGFAAHYNDGTNAHTGLIRDSGTKEYHFFKGYTPVLDANNNIDLNDPSYQEANVHAAYFKGNVIATTVVADGVNLGTYTQSAYDQANTATNNAASASSYANTGINNAASASQYANTAINNAASASAYANTGINNAASASAYANTAINNAASASAYANTGINNAASASAYANAGITLAQAAYNQANTARTFAVGGLFGGLSFSTGKGNSLTFGSSTGEFSTYLGTLSNGSLLAVRFTNSSSGKIYNGYFTLSSAFSGGTATASSFTPFLSGSNNPITDGASFSDTTTVEVYTDIYLARNSRVSDSIALAQAAFDTANNAAAGSVDQYARNTANSAGIYANTGINLAQAAFNQGNSTATVANTAVNDAASASAYANTGINNAASASAYANTAINNAASASLYANNAINDAASASAYANTGINNAASASAYANSGITIAGAAFDKANAANSLAQSAFDAANNVVSTFDIVGDAGSFQFSTGGTLTIIGGDGITTDASVPNQLRVNVDSSVIRTTGVPNQTINGTLAITGDLVVAGNTVTQDVQTLVVEDSLIHLAANNSVADSLDIGFYGQYASGGVKYTALMRDATDGKYKVLINGTEEPSAGNTVNVAAFSTGTIVADIEATSVSTSTITATGLAYLASPGSTDAIVYRDSAGVLKHSFTIDGGTF